MQYKEGKLYRYELSIRIRNMSVDIAGADRTPTVDENHNVG